MPREQILSRIRQALGRDALPPEAAAALDARRPAHTRIGYSDDLVERFITRFQSRAGTVARVACRADLPAALAAYRAEHGLPARAAIAAPLADLPWGLEHHPGPAGQEEVLGVTGCLAGIAEMGSILTVSGPAHPTTLNFVPDYHVVVLPAAHIVRHYEDAWALLRARPGGLPRCTNIISGPSRTGDVELTIQLGAHGPRRVHVLLLEAPESAEG